MEDPERKSTSILASPRLASSRNGRQEDISILSGWEIDGDRLKYNSEEIFWPRNAREDIPTSANSLEALWL